jgi:hypothetical protein
MEEGTGFAYEAVLPDAVMREGIVEYSIVVWGADGARTFPGGHRGSRGEWDFTGTDTWRVSVVGAAAPIVLFDARRDLDNLLYPSRWGYVPFQTAIIPGATPGAMAVRGVVEDLEPEPRHFAVRSFLSESARNRLEAAGPGGALRILARAATQPRDRMEVALVGRDGSAWGATVELTDEWSEITVPLSSLRRTSLALLPRPYPQFLPYGFDAAVQSAGPVVADIDGLQFAVGARHFAGTPPTGQHGFEIERVLLDPDPERW